MSFVKRVGEIMGPDYSINLFVLMPSSSSVNLKRKGQHCRAHSEALSGSRKK
jgi:hypothetical protein